MNVMFGERCLGVSSMWPMEVVLETSSCCWRVQRCVMVGVGGVGVRVMGWGMVGSVIDDDDDAKEDMDGRRVYLRGFKILLE